MSETLVHIDGFRMDFGDKTVIRDLSFDVARGETFGFLGSNGSGKTTTIRALLGIYQPTGGTLHINGRPFKPEDGDRLGYLPEGRGLYKKEKVIDIMTYLGRLKGIDRHAARAWSLEYLDRVGLPDKAGMQLDKLSGGQQQKVQLGVTIMNEPELLILDEPTKGFDPVNRRLLMDIVAEQKTKGATVVMVTHQMEEVERLCDRVIPLKNGTAEAYGTIDEVQNQYGGRVIRLKHAGSVPTSPRYRVTMSETNYSELSITDDTDEADILKDLIEPTLEEKENRVTEMILTTLNPTTLISGKVLALFGVGAVQILVFASPFIIGYLFFREQVSIPDFDLTALVFEPVPMIIGLLLLIGGFALFTTTLVAIGAVMPTAKEAGNFMGVMMALIFVPFYAISLIFSNPQALIVQVFTYFPFSSPVTAMLRNGLGSLSIGEAAIVIAILFIGSAIMFRLAVRLFQHGSISYTSKVNIKTALCNGRSAPAAGKSAN